ncbi:orotidine-5'-phosphate decarboxylase [Candidatus Micrarchaeota archaeon]|nr:orotidine-5'-phosphate decarboxylase [Candidatus Micrarchaeota archaeon]
MNFADELIAKIIEKQNPTVVGLDPSVYQMSSLKGGGNDETAKNFFELNKAIIDAVHDFVPAVKPQSAFYEVYGASGMAALKQTIDYAHSKNLLVIIDAKRGDIGHTSQAYADAWIGERGTGFDCDCITVNPYLGSDGILPFVENAKKFGKGIFALVKTSNPGSGEFQDIKNERGELNYETVARQVVNWGKDAVGERGISSIGAVVGATFPAQAVGLRKLMEKQLFLVPGFGAQGGAAADVVPCFNEKGIGAVVNNSRGIMFAYKKLGMREEQFAEAAKIAALSMQKQVNDALKAAGKQYW